MRLMLSIEDVKQDPLEHVYLTLDSDLASSFEPVLLTDTDYCYVDSALKSCGPKEYERLLNQRQSSADKIVSEISKALLRLMCSRDIRAEV